MTTNNKPTVSLVRLQDLCCPFCGDLTPQMNGIVDCGDDDAEVYEDQQCKTCGRKWRVAYGPVGVVYGDEYLPASDDPTWRATDTESEVSDAG